MRKILIFGNSGSGKSTLAKRLCELYGLAHLDLDTLAWLPITPPERKSITESGNAISQFIGLHQTWVIEGCYSDLLELAATDANEVIFMNLSVEQCILNAKARPWEPHKYDSKAAQDKNLSMLIEWIHEYKVRDDAFSEASHLNLYEAFSGKKTLVTQNQ